MIKAVIFDMDGVLIDSEMMQSRALEVLLKEYGKTPIKNDAGIVHTPGLKGIENIKLLKEKYEIDQDLDLLLEKREEIYTPLLRQKVKLVPNVLELLALLKANKFRIALASNAILQKQQIVIKKFHLQDYFEVTVSAEDVQRPKPFPDIYIETVKRLNLNPQECVAIEDSETGVTAAVNAGIHVIALKTIYTKNQNLSKADRIVDSLKEVTIEFIESL